jgi:GNAT superfamily N-acetyltransferase
MREHVGPARVATNVVVRPVNAPTESEITELAAVFDEYRAHYGEVIQAGESARWLQDMLGHERLTTFIAEIDGKLIGFASTMDVPASLRLGHYWQIRDLFVVPSRRRLGVARLLLDSIRSSATAAGALRLAVQTEDNNAVALRLYEQSGFAQVQGYLGLTLQLAADEGS